MLKQPKKPEHNKRLKKLLQTQSYFDAYKVKDWKDFSFEQRLDEIESCYEVLRECLKKLKQEIKNEHNKD